MDSHSYKLMLHVVLFAHAFGLLAAATILEEAGMISNVDSGTSSRILYNFPYKPRPQPSPQGGCGACNQEQAAPPISHPSPPPPPPAGPQPSDFKDIRLYKAYFVIQQFKTTITCDAQGITSSWSGFDICKTYQGLFCETPPDNSSATALAAVDFNGYGLCSPALTGFLDKLPDLAFFHANSNNFTGPVPNLSKLPFLYEVDLSNNRFSGPFPTDVLAIPQIAFLDLRFNFFSGTVPTAAFSVKGIDVLFLNNNGFTSSLPENLGFTTAKYITLANNAFTGSIPRSIANASSTLTEVLFLGNKLSGCLPYEIGFLNRATVFDAGNNLLTGPIPYSIACLSKVEQLNLAGNFLYGDVPEIVCSELGIANLQNFSLSNNYFTRIGPACHDLVDKGILDLRMNCIPGLREQRPHEDCVGFRQDATHCPLPSTYYLVPCKKEIPCDNYTTAAAVTAAAQTATDGRPLGTGVADQFPSRFGGGFNAFSFRQPPTAGAGAGAFARFARGDNRGDDNGYSTPGRRTQEQEGGSASTSPTYSALRRQNHRSAGFIPLRW